MYWGERPKRAGGRDGRTMRMMKAEAAAGIWLDGRETSRGESRHRAPAARTENGKKRQMVRRKKPFTTQISGGNNYLCFALLRCFHFKIKYGRKVKFRASYTLLLICPILALFRPHLKVSVVDSFLPSHQYCVLVFWAQRESPTLRFEANIAFFCL